MIIVVLIYTLGFSHQTYFELISAVADVLGEKFQKMLTKYIYKPTGAPFTNN